MAAAVASHIGIGLVFAAPRYAVSGVAAALSAFQFHGSSVSSSCALVRPDTMRSSTSVSQASGSTSFSLAVYAERRTMPSGFARRLAVVAIGVHHSA
jgi:hypothetical protein